ncbi:hypothetical protein F4820DRAFT_445229 [Hypoxylon rubiginosum]|uniref:Uncharacterized protein n=1 Tax=Hypoxylon rubiginosum TaxID=110542 RepID=A0ACB9ZAH8_9PEZI|nr:hypothetical protein F4820DRAFT_445229 [Hypoxylon rubiginosum]
MADEAGDEAAIKGGPSEPLTDDALRRLNNQQAERPRPSTPEGESRCVMCLETRLISHLVTLPCAHQLHARCLRHWVFRPQDDRRGEEGLRFYESQHRCPLCRHPLVYLCGHRISRHILRPGVRVDAMELAVPCPNWETASQFPHLGSAAATTSTEDAASSSSAPPPPPATPPGGFWWQSDRRPER